MLYTIYNRISKDPQHVRQSRNAEIVGINNVTITCGHILNVRLYYYTFGMSVFIKSLHAICSLLGQVCCTVIYNVFSDVIHILAPVYFKGLVQVITARFYRIPVLYRASFYCYAAFVTNAIFLKQGYFN
jgi:predicted Abi (CAAX) family protease